MIGNGSDNLERSFQAKKSIRVSRVAHAEVVRMASLERRELLTVTATTLSGTEGIAIASTTTVATFDLSTGLVGNSAADFSATVFWGDGSTSAGTISGAGSNYVVKAGHTYVVGADYVTNIVVNGKDQTQNSGVGSAAIVDIPIISTVSPIVNAVSSPSISATGFFTDAYPGLNATDYVSTVNWSDGTTSSGSVQGGSGAFSAAATHTYVANGTYPVTVTLARKLDGQSITSQPTGAIVSNAALTLSSLPIQAIQHQQVTKTVATFSDTTPGLTFAAYTALITWRPGVVSTGIVTGENGQFSVSGTTTYTSPGNFPILVEIVQKVGSIESNASVSTQATVAPVSSPVLTSAPIQATVGASFDGKVATFQDVWTGLTAANYQATITWPGGTTSQGNITGSNGVFEVAGVFVFSSTGSFPVKVDLTRIPDGSNSTTSSTANVTATAQPQLVGQTFNPVAGTAFSGTIASFTDAYPGAVQSDYTVLITWKPGVVTPGTIEGSNGSFVVKGLYTYDAVGSYPVKIDLTRTKGNGEASTTSTASVSATAQPQLVGQTFNPVVSTQFNGTVASFTDAYPDALASDYSALITWKPGVVTPGTIEGSNGSFVVKGLYTYDAVGSYTVKIDLTRTKGNGAGTTISTANVIANLRTPVVEVFGALSPSSDTGMSNQDGITNINRPTFIGTAPTGSTVQLLVQWYGQNNQVQVGQGLVDSTGRWSIQTVPLVDGVYSIFVRVISSTGQITSIMPLGASNQAISVPLVIDTVAPVIASGLIDRSNRRIVLSFRDNLSGMDQASVENTSNYNLFGPHPYLYRADNIYLLNSTSILTSDPTVSSVNIAPNSPGKWKVNGIRLLSGGIQDVAGNALDGDFKGRFPTGNGRPGGLFNWKFSPAISFKPTLPVRKFGPSKRK